MERQKQPQESNQDSNQVSNHGGNQAAEEDERDRRATNIFLAVAAVLVVGGGLWLVNSMADSRKAQMCLESGRRNCNPIPVPARQPD
ncbi:MAG: hypothetical protein PSV22_17630 [Pseudolabrys sp.]|jgi:hypothetical protein|nr:hypothetical protein [Pseudolabrys sp.]